jgi:hypothetical protein
MSCENKSDYMEGNTEDDTTDDPDVLVEHVDASNIYSTVNQADEDKNKTDIFEARKRESSDKDEEYDADDNDYSDEDQE